MAEKYLRGREILSFSCAGFGRSMIYTIMSTFLLIFYTDAVGIDPVHAGIIIFAARIFDAANDPLMGIIADKTHTRFGKLRPYLLFSPLLIMVSTVALFYAPDFSYGGKVAYAAITYVLWGICFTIQDVPFWGMSAVVSPIENERNRFISTARIFCTIGGIVPTLVVPVLRSSMGYTKGYFVSGLIFGVCGSLLSLLAFFGTTERVEQTKEKASAGEIVSAFVKNKPLLLLILSTVLGSTMLMIQTSGSYIATYLIKDSGIIPANTVQTAMTVAIGAGMLLAMVIMPVAGKRFSLRDIYIASALFGALIHGVIYLVGYSDFYVFLVLLVIAGLPLGIFNVITYAMIADSIDFLEWKTGRRSEGICFASQTFLSKLTAGISTLITSFFLKAISFVQPVNDVPVLDQPESVFRGMFVMITVVPLVGLALCSIPMFFNDFSGKKREKILTELKEKRETKNG